jgi:hypothetical protein
MLDLAIPLVENPGIVRHSGSTAPMKGRQRRSASHVGDRGCVDADAAEALAGTNVIEAANMTQNAVNDVVDTLAARVGPVVAAEPGGMQERVDDGQS